MVRHLEDIVQQQLVCHPYNTIGNFIRFYHAFQNSSGHDLASFFTSYSPVITPEHHTCVGLGYDLLGRIYNSEFGYNNPHVCSRFYLISCEECIIEIERYCRMGEPQHNVEKEHVAVALPIEIQGRRGFALLDTGYHVSRIVTVMVDGLYPHTGWFVQSDTLKSRKEYMYEMHPGMKGYVLWNIRDTRQGQVKQHTSLFYAKKSFLSAVDVTERRNLVYKFRSLIKRRSDGSLLAGFYFPINPTAAFTLFFDDGAGLQELKVRIEDVHRDQLDCVAEEGIRACDNVLQLAEKRNLKEVLKEVTEVLNDDDFVAQLQDIDGHIDEGASFT